MMKAARLSYEDQEFVANLIRALKARSARSSPVQLAQLAGMAFQKTFTGGRREEKLANALARGLSVREKMAAEEGGSMSAEEAARQLGMTKQSVLNLYHTGKVLAWRTEKQGALRFPVWQFDGDQRLPGLEKVMAQLNQAAMLDDWGKIGFFLQTNERFEGRRALDLLREGRVGDVLQAAQRYVE
jgi:hypothetical protein